MDKIASRAQDGKTSAPTDPDPYEDNQLIQSPGQLSEATARRSDSRRRRGERAGGGQGATAIRQAKARGGERGGAARQETAPAGKERVENGPAGPRRRREAGNASDSECVFGAGQADSHSPLQTGIARADCRSKRKRPDVGCGRERGNRSPPPCPRLQPRPPRRRTNPQFRMLPFLLRRRKPRPRCSEPGFGSSAPSATAPLLRCRLNLSARLPRCSSPFQPPPAICADTARPSA